MKWQLSLKITATYLTVNNYRKNNFIVIQQGEPRSLLCLYSELRTEAGMEKGTQQKRYNSAMNQMS